MTGVVWCSYFDRAVDLWVPHDALGVFGLSLVCLVNALAAMKPRSWEEDRLVVTLLLGALTLEGYTLPLTHIYLLVSLKWSFSRYVYAAL